MPPLSTDQNTVSNAMADVQSKLNAFITAVQGDLATIKTVSAGESMDECEALLADLASHQQTVNAICGTWQDCGNVT